MGAFNMVGALVPCPKCGNVFDQRVQFKYGDCWQHSYVLGDTLGWGGNDTGERTNSRVRISAYGERDCPHCGYDDPEYVVILEENVLSGVNHRTKADELALGDEYWVVDSSESSP